MKVLYVGNVLTKQKVKELKLSIAGKKYELAFLESLNDILNNDLEIISRGRIVGGKIKYHDFLFGQKKYKVLNKSSIPVISDFVLNVNLLFELIRWTLLNLKYRKKIVLLNSPLGVSLLALIFKFFFRVKVFSLTIDTPFISENKFNGVLGFYSKIKLKLGHKLLHLFSGIAVLNLNVISVLNLKIPVLLTKIGYNKKDCFPFTDYQKKNDKFTLVYVGTLMKFKGLDKLIKAVSEMDSNVFELIICGDGPMKEEIILYTEKYHNIIYKGRVYDKDLRLTQENADLLINILQVSKVSEDFGFPSKLIDYILSGRPVLSNSFYSLPKDFYSFIHILEDDTISGINSAIMDIYNKSEDDMNYKCKLGYTYIKDHYTYQKISEEFLNFINETKYGILNES